jgi:hypothetical protein
MHKLLVMTRVFMASLHKLMRPRMAVFSGFRRGYHAAQAIERATVDAAFETCFAPAHM